MNTELLSNLVITKVISVSTMYSPQGKGAKRSNRSRWAVLIKYEGETVYTSNGKRQLSDATHLVLLPKGCSYEWHCTKAGHFCTVEFESEARADEPIVFSVKNSEKILRLFKELEYKRNLRSATLELESIRDTYSILLAIQHSASDSYLPTEMQARIAPALEYISRNYNTPITNDRLAALTGMSTVYFRKLFSKLIGTSPIAYVHALRIERAKEMLRSDYGSLSDLARSLGYAGLYDFSRDFKKHTGVAPSKYEPANDSDGESTT